MYLCLYSQTFLVPLTPTPSLGLSHIFNKGGLFVFFSAFLKTLQSSTSYICLEFICFSLSPQPRRWSGHSSSPQISAV